MWTVRRGQPAARAVAIGAIGGLLCGEGLHRLIRLSSGDVAGWIGVVVGIAAAAVGQWSAARRPAGAWVLWIGSFVVIAALTYAAYGHSSL